MKTAKEIAEEVYENQEEYTGIYVGEWSEDICIAAMKKYALEVIYEIQDRILNKDYRPYEIFEAINEVKYKITEQ